MAKSAFLNWRGLRALCVAGALMVPGPVLADTAAQYGQILGVWQRVNETLIELAHEKGGKASWVRQIELETPVAATDLRQTDIVWLMAHYRSRLDKAAVEEGFEPTAHAIDLRAVVRNGVADKSDVLLQDSIALLEQTLRYAQVAGASAMPVSGPAQGKEVDWRDAHQSVALAARRLAIYLDKIDGGRPAPIPGSSTTPMSGVGHPYGPHEREEAVTPAQFAPVSTGRPSA